MDKKTYNIYLDESSIDNPKNHFMVIGALFIERNKRDEIKNKIKELRNLEKIYTEIKWSRMSKKNLPLLKAIVDLFFEYGESVQFHCIVVDKTKVRYDMYHENDKELGFYKFMYQLLKQKLKLDENYYLFIDYKQNKVNNRLKKLSTFLNNGNILHIQSYHSVDNILIQVADLFTGAVGYSKNNFNGSSVKKELIVYIANKSGRQNLNFKSLPSENKFNIFEINLTKR